jgi:heat shock protein HslJ
MTQVTAYSSLLPYMVTELPMCPDNLISQVLAKTGREFCRRTEAWQEDLDIIAGVEYQQEYTLTHSYSAYVHRLLWVKVGSSPYPPHSYELVDESVLKFASNYVPHSFDDLLLTCGTAGDTTLATWTAVTDASATFSVSGGTHEVTDMDFSGAADFDDIALSIQTGLRAEMESNLVHVQWVTDHFVIWDESAEMSYLTAGTEGTDISGASWMNGLTGTGTLSGHIIARVAFRPQLTADDLPDWFMDRYGEAMIAGAKAELLKQPRKEWSDRELASYYMGEWLGWIGRAKAEKRREFKEITPGMTA